MNPIRVGIAARRKTACGIRDYAEQLARAWPPEIATQWIEIDGLSSPADWRRAARSANAVDVVHAHYEYGLFGRVSPLRNHYAAFMRALPVPAVVTLHDALPRLWQGWPALARSGPAGWLRQAAYLPFLFRWEAAQYRLAARSVAHTADIARRAARAVGRAKVLLCPLPIPRCARRWQPTGRSPEAARLVTPGFIKEHKGYREALDLFAQHPRWEWVLAGGAQDERDRAFLKRLQAEIAARGLSGRVRIAGYLPEPELEAATRDGDAALFPFRRATGSGSVALALGLGMPVLATDLPALREFDGAGIAFLDPARPAAWAEAALRLLQDRERCARLAAQNRAYAQEHGYDRLARRLAALFREIVNRGSGGDHGA